MRILQVTSHLAVGGIPRYVLSLSLRLAAKGHEVILASDGTLPEAYRHENLKHWAFPLRTSAEFGLQVFWATRQLEKRLREEPVDILHAHTRVGQVVAERISRRLHIPYVTTWHGIYTTRLGRRLWPCTGERAIAISGPVREHLLRDFHVPQRRIRLVYNGIPVSHYLTPPDPEALLTYRQRWQIRAGQPVIGGIGRLAAGRVKGFDSILLVAYLLKEEVPDLQVLIVGDGPRRPFLEDVVRRFGLQDRVRFVGVVSDIRIPLGLMDVFIFPSRWPEAFGLTLVEAMASGRAVVATEVGAVPEIVRQGIDGWLVPPEDPSALTEKVLSLLKDRDAALRLGRKAQERAREMFDLNRMADEIEGVYREVVSR